MYKNRKDVGGYQNAVHSGVIAELSGNMFHASAQLGFRLSLKLGTSSSWMYKNRKDVYMQLHKGVIGRAKWKYVSFQ